MTVSFDKDRKFWRYDFFLARKRYRGYCVNEDDTPARNRTEAKAAQAIVRGAYLRQPKDKRVRRGTYTFAHAMAAYVARSRHLKNWDNLQVYLAELKDVIGPATPIGDVEGKVPDYIKHARRQKILLWLGGTKDRRAGALRLPKDKLWKDTGRRRSDSTTNRYLTTLRTVLNLAHNTRDPATGERMLPIAPTVELLREPVEAARPLGDANLRQILQTSPRHVSDTVVLCIDAGLRLNEALGLENDQFDPEYRGLWLDSRTKGKRGEFVPLGETAFKLVAQRVKESRAAGQSRIILYRGRWGTQTPRPINSISKAWQHTLRKLGLKGRFRFHNTRADYVSYLGNEGAAPMALKDLARHRDIKTTMRYLKVSDKAKRQAVAMLDGRAATAGLDLGAVPLVHKAGTKTAPGHPQKSPTPKRLPAPARRKAAV